MFCTEHPNHEVGLADWLTENRTYLTGSQTREVVGVRSDRHPRLHKPNTTTHSCKNPRVG